METKENGREQARIAWGGDNYIISDGLSTEYYINLQKEKAAQEKKELELGLEPQEIAHPSDLYRSLDDIIREKKKAQYKSQQKVVYQPKSSKKSKMQQSVVLKQPQKQSKKQRKPSTQKKDKQTVIMPGSQMAYSRRRSFVCFQLLDRFCWLEFLNIFTEPCSMVILSLG